MPTPFACGAVLMGGTFVLVLLLVLCCCGGLVVGARCWVLRERAFLLVPVLQCRSYRFWVGGRWWLSGGGSGGRGGWGVRVVFENFTVDASKYLFLVVRKSLPLHVWVLVPGVWGLVELMCIRSMRPSW